MPTFRHGKNAQFKLGTTGAPTALTDITTSTDSVSFPRQMDLAETTTFTAGARTYIPGFPNQTFSIGGKFDATTDAQLSALAGDTSGIPVCIQYRPEGAGAGRVQYDAPGGAGAAGVYITNYSISSPVNDVVSWTAECTTSGVITRSTP